MLTNIRRAAAVLAIAVVAAFCVAGTAVAEKSIGADGIGRRSGAGVREICGERAVVHDAKGDALVYFAQVELPVSEVKSGDRIDCVVRAVSVTNAPFGRLGVALYDRPEKKFKIQTKPVWKHTLPQGGYDDVRFSFVPSELNLRGTRYMLLFARTPRAGGIAVSRFSWNVVPAAKVAAEEAARAAEAARRKAAEALVALPGARALEQGCGSEDWTPPSAWRPKTVAGRTFHCFGTSLSPDGKYPPPVTNSFNGMSAEYRIYPARNAKGNWVYDFPSLKEVPAADGTVRPFTLNYYPRIPCRPNVFLTGTLEPMGDAYAAFLASHSNFVGFVTLEWVNDSLMPLGDGAGLVRNRRKQYRITEEEFKSVRARDEYVHGCDDRDQFTTNLLRKTFDRIVEVCQGDPRKLWIGEGSFCADHLCADWGAGALAFETSRNYCFWQHQMMFCRGAARQYGLPWYWYVASFYLGYNSDGKWSGQGNQCADTPDRGLSRSAVRRVSYLTWLTGASCYQREGMEHALYKPGTHELSDEGRIYDEFWNFTQTHRRGVPYQPVALLVPFNRGYTRAGGRAYKKFRYTHADKMLDAVMSTILEWPKNARRGDAQKGVERVMANSKYGDLFDVLVPNASRREFFRRSVGDYPVAVLIGDYGEDAEMAADLRAYVEKGGKLVLNVAQTGADYAWAKGGEVICRRAGGQDLYSLKRVGRGFVVLSHEPYWCPWADGESPETGVCVIGATTSYPSVGWLFDRLLKPLCPLRVTGEVQYGLNRLPDGWQVYLVNNGGVTKFGDKAETFDPKGAEVTIDCSALPTGMRAVERMTGTELSREKGVVGLTVPSGDLRIVDIVP